MRVLFNVQFILKIEHKYDMALESCAFCYIKRNEPRKTELHSSILFFPCANAT